MKVTLVLLNIYILVRKVLNVGDKDYEAIV